MKTRHFIYTGAALLIFFALVIVHFLNEPSNPTVPSESIEASPNPTSTAAADLQTQPNDLPKFTYESNYDEIPYIDDNALRFIMDAYAATDELECVFETGDESLYPLFKEKFRKLLLLEEQVYDKETGQYLYVNEIGEFKDYKFNTGIINPNDSGYTVYDLKFFFFDINGDNMPELVIYNNRVKLIVGYDINYDLLYIWEYYAARSPVILGTRKIYWYGTHSRSVNLFIVLDENANDEMRYLTYAEGYPLKDGSPGVLILITLPHYVNQSINAAIPKPIRSQGINFETYKDSPLFRITEKQWELFTEENTIDINKAYSENSYSYSQLFGE